MAASIGSVVVNVRLFAGLRERAGTDRLEVELPDGARVADLLAAMAATPVGEIKPRECVVAVNREYASADEPVHAGDEVALVPPVSGGAGPVRHVRITREKLDLAALADAVRDPRAGAVVLFEGVTREVPELDYEAYAEMAQARLEQIAAEEAERHGLTAVAIEHRTGTVALSEPSVIVAASAPHRGEAFAGARAADRPRQGRGADLEGRGHGVRPRARPRHAAAYVARRTSGSRLGVNTVATSTASNGTARPVTTRAALGGGQAARSVPMRCLGRCDGYPCWSWSPRWRAAVAMTATAPSHRSSSRPRHR